jgi:hypothetical protein
MECWGHKYGKLGNTKQPLIFISFLAMDGAQKGNVTCSAVKCRAFNNID